MDIKHKHCPLSKVFLYLGIVTSIFTQTNNFFLNKRMNETLTKVSFAFALGLL